MSQHKLQQTKPHKTTQHKLSFDITKFELFGDFVLVRAIRPTGANGLIDPAQYEDKPEFGEIIKLGDDVTHPKAKVGLTVRFGKYSTESIRTNGEDYFLVHFEDMSGYLPK